MKSNEKYLDPFGIGDTLPGAASPFRWGNPQVRAAFLEFSAELREAILETYPWTDLSLFPMEGSGCDDLLSRVKSRSALARRFHQAGADCLKTVLAAVPEEGGARRRSVFWCDQLIQATSPANFFWTNPVAVRKWIKSQGESLACGVRNMADDLLRGDAMAPMADDGAFQVGENLATTCGSVVYRNELMELIQYAPAKESVFRIPVVLVQPPINKFYIFDLSQRTSFVRFLLDEGFTVFITSWKNPGAKMRDTTFADYMLKGVEKAVRVAGDICGTGRAHAAGYCLAGTLLASLMAWLNAEKGQEEVFPVASWTQFAALTDFRNPGDLEILVNEESLAGLTARMAADGFLDGRLLGLAFRLLKADSLIWHQYVHSYLCGAPAPRSDFLYWNADNTRLPAAMCSFYLRELFLGNRLRRSGALELAGRAIDLSAIVQPLYAVGATGDHISPWKEAFRTVNLCGGPARFVLSTEGHITGIVNPPSARSKKRYWAGEAPRDALAEEWYKGREAMQGSWWEDWAGWLASHDGRKGSPPPMGGGMYRKLERAPGSYVLE